MSDAPDISDIPETSDAAETPETPTGKLPIAIEMRHQIKEMVEAQQKKGVIRGRVIESLAEAEIARRTDLLSKAFAKREEKDRELKKIRPKPEYDENHKKVSETFGKQEDSDRRKLKEEIAKIDKAIMKAVEQADYEGVKKYA